MGGGEVPVRVGSGQPEEQHARLSAQYVQGSWGRLEPAWEKHKGRGERRCGWSHTAWRPGLHG